MTHEQPKVYTDIKMRPVGEIHPYPANAKMHPTTQVKQIAKSIQAFGFNQPIVVDAHDVIIVGHGRYRAATEELKMAEVPVLTIDISEDEAKAYRLADNRLNESEWDMALVMQELRTLSAPLVDLSGFGNLGISLDEATLSDEFSLGNEGKEPFQQMSFVLSDSQAARIKDALKIAREAEDYDEAGHDGNENKNGAALSYIIDSWMAQKQ